MHRLKVLAPIIYRGKALPAGRLIRCTRDSVSHFQQTYGSAVAFWEDWPNRATEPFADPTNAMITEDDIKAAHAPLSLEAYSWESLEEE